MPQMHFSGLSFEIGGKRSKTLEFEQDSVHAMYQWQPEMVFENLNKKSQDLDFFISISPYGLRQSECAIAAACFIRTPTPRTKRASLRRKPAPDMFDYYSYHWENINATVTISFRYEQSKLTILQVSYIVEVRLLKRKAYNEAHRVACLLMLDDTEYRFLGRAQQIITIPSQEHRIYLWKASTSSQAFPNVEFHNSDDNFDKKDFWEHTETLEKLKITLSRNRDLRLLISPRREDDDNNNNDEEIYVCDSDDFSNSYRVLPVIMMPRHKKLRVRFYNVKNANIRWAEHTLLQEDFGKDGVLTAKLDGVRDGEVKLYFKINDQGSVVINMVRFEIKRFKKALNFRINSKNRTF